MNAATRVEDLFLATLEKSDPVARAAYLDQACNGDAELRRRVERLLEAHPKAAGFLDHAPADATAAHVPAAGPAPGALIAGRYKLLEKLGEGGMGEVWVAEQTQPVRRKVALKLIKPGMDSRSVLARFEAERQALALMDHPNIAKVLDGGLTDGEPRGVSPGRPFFAMEYVKGVPITDYCDNARLTVAERLALFLPICQAVQHAHQKGIIHRDLKPSNVLVCLYDGKPVPKVIDFGLAKAMHQPLTEKTLHTAHGMMMGTPLYMSPEQAEFNNLDVDTRTDVYSLGVLLYELLTGTTPLEKRRYQEAAFAEMLRIIKEEDPPRPSTRLSTAATLPAVAAQRRAEPVKLSRLVKGDLDWIVMKALEKDRARRYDTANGLALDVQRHLADEPVLAGPPSAAYRLRKFVRRNRGKVVAAGLVLLALVAGVIGTTLGMIQASAAERHAVEAREQADRDRDAAEKARLQAIETLADLTQNTVGQLLTMNPKFTPEQRAFLDRILTRFDRLTSSLPDKPAVLRFKADCYAQVASMHLTLGNYAGSLQTYQKAGELYRRGLDLAPDDLDSADGRLTALCGMAAAYDRLGRKDAAGPVVEEGIVAAEAVLKRHPDHVPLLLDLGGLYHNRAACIWPDEVGRKEALDRAIELAERARVLTAQATGILHDNAVTNLVGSLSSRADHFAMLTQITREDLARCRADVERIKGLISDTQRTDLLSKLGDSWVFLSTAFARLQDLDAAVGAAREGVGVYEGILRRYPADAEVRNYLMQHYRTLADHLQGVGRKQEAELVYRQALALGDGTAAAGRASVMTSHERSVVATALAWIAWESGNREEARRGLERAIKAARDYLSAHGEVPAGASDEARREDALRLAQTCNRVGHLAEELKQWPECIELTRKQLDFARQGIPAHGRPDPRVVDHVVWGHQTLTVAYLATGRADQALEAWKGMLQAEVSLPHAEIHEPAILHLVDTAAKLKALGKTPDVAMLAPALADLDARFAADPKAEETRQQYRRTYRFLGLLHEYSGRYEDAVRAYEKVKAAGEADDDFYKFSRLGVAVCLDALGKEEEAEAAMPGWTRPTSGWFRLNKLARNGRPARAVELLGEDVAPAMESATDHYNAACIYSLASAAVPAKREEYASRAVQLLKFAQEKGYFQDRKQVEEARTDTDLSPLRDRDDFKKLQAEWEKKTKPKS